MKLNVGDDFPTHRLDTRLVLAQLSLPKEPDAVLGRYCQCRSKCLVKVRLQKQNSSHGDSDRYEPDGAGLQGPVSDQERGGDQ